MCVAQPFNRAVCTLSQPILIRICSHFIRVNPFPIANLGLPLNTHQHRMRIAILHFISSGMRVCVYFMKSPKKKSNKNGSRMMMILKRTHRMRPKQQLKNQNETHKHIMHCNRFGAATKRQTNRQLANYYNVAFFGKFVREIVHHDNNEHILEILSLQFIIAFRKIVVLLRN